MSEAARWEERYRVGDTPWDTGQPATELRRFLVDEEPAPGRALELGCGTGTNAVFLARQGFDVTALDVSPLAIERARARSLDEGVVVRFLVANLLSPPDLGPPFPFVFDCGCYHAVRRSDPTGYVRTLQRVTAPGGLVLILAGNARQQRDHGPPVVAEHDLRAELGRDFDILSLEETHFDPTPTDRITFLAWRILLRKPA